MLSKIVAVGVETGGMSWMVNSISVKVFADISLSEQINQMQIQISTYSETDRLVYFQPHEVEECFHLPSLTQALTL